MEKTKKLYEEDVMRRAFCATVLTCAPCEKGFSVVLDATVFYPEGGGQPADHGALGCARVVDVHEKEGVIVHTVTAPLPVGEIVQGDIDWARRLDMMQQHSGEHVVSGIVHAQYGYDNVGFHIGEDVVTVDFSGPLTPQELHSTEEAANWVVWNDAPVEISHPSAEELAQLAYRSKKELTGDVRIVSIGTADVCACCGTHVQRTSQIGAIKLLSAQRYKGGTRVTMVCGQRAVRDYTEKHESVSEISALLSAKPTEVVAAVQRLQAENLALRQTQAQLENSLFAKEAQSAVDEKNALRFVQQLSSDSQRRLCLTLCEACKGVCGVFCQTQEGAYQYAVGSAAQDVRTLAKQMNESLAGRGGGKPGLVQGTVHCDEAAVRTFFARL